MLVLEALEILASLLALVVGLAELDDNTVVLVVQVIDLLLKRTLAVKSVVAGPFGLANSLLKPEGLGTKLGSSALVSEDLVLQVGDLTLNVADFAALNVKVILEVVSLSVGVAELVKLVVEL